MNGELYQICCIAAAAKKALKTKTVISYKQLGYEKRVAFQFLPKRDMLFKKTKTAENVTQWYAHCLEKGLQDIKFLTPISVNDRALLGFSNATQSSLVCFWGERISYFIAQWEFDSVKNMWNVLYVKKKWPEAPSVKPCFENNTDSFKTVLTEIKELAYNIECDYFAEVFQKAFNILSGSLDYKETEHNMPLPDIPEENLRLF